MGKEFSRPGVTTSREWIEKKFLVVRIDSSNELLARIG